jgi:DNA-binding response OmpR family regulator
MASSILIVDDDRQITDYLERFLSRQGYHVLSAGSSAQMTLAMRRERVDLLILDVGLPDGDGFQIAREIRATSAMPIILLTVRDELYDRIIGLELGADDYVAKPFEPRELLARIRAVLRRAQDMPPATQDAGRLRCRFEGLRLDGTKRRLSTASGVEVPLTSSEFELLVALVRRAGETVSRTQIMDIVYGGAVHVTDRAVDAHVARLRRKLKAAGSRGDLVRTVHGHGYCLACAVAAEDATVAED